MKDTFKQAADTLLAANGIELDQLGQVFATIAQKGVDDADLYFQVSRSEGWALEEGIVKSGSFSIDQGVGVRAVSGDKSAFAYSDDISMTALDHAAQAVKSIGATGDKGQVGFSFKNSHDFQRRYGKINPIGSIDDVEKVALLHRLEKLARDMDPRVIQVMASVAGSHDTILVAQLNGHTAADIRPLVRVSIQVIVEENGRREQGSAGGGGRYDFHYFTDDLLHQYAQQAVSQAITNLGAIAAPAGVMPVVLSSGWAGILLHEAIGHGLEGDFNRKKTSAFSDKLGQRVAIDDVTVVDDGTIENRRGSLNIDDEGTPTEKTVLIENGYLKNYMQDKMNARLMNMKPTGNGRRESYASQPLPRMTNTYMLNGKRDPKEIIESVEKGIYAVNFSGGQVDITNGKFVFVMSEAYLIENGKITQPVTDATLIGNGLDVLTKISMVGNDLALDTGVGTCGKEGQSVPVGVGQPTLRVDGLTVGGSGS